MATSLLQANCTVPRVTGLTIVYCTSNSVVTVINVSMVTNESAELMGAVVGMNPAILLSEPRTVKSAISSAGLSYEGKGQYNNINHNTCTLGHVGPLSLKLLELAL